MTPTRLPVFWTVSFLREAVQLVFRAGLVAELLHLLVFPVAREAAAATGTKVLQSPTIVTLKSNLV